MTENERVLRDIIIDGNGFDYDESIPQSIFEEIQQYRAIGTVEGYEKAIQASIEYYNLMKEYKAKVDELEAIGTIEECRNAYAKGYNQGTIDRAEEVTKAREQGYAKAIDDFLGKIKEHYKLCKAVPSYYLLEEIAEKMRGAK